MNDITKIRTDLPAFTTCLAKVAPYKPAPTIKCHSSFSSFSNFTTKHSRNYPIALSSLVHMLEGNSSLSDSYFRQ